MARTCFIYILCIKLYITYKVIYTYNCYALSIATGSYSCSPRHYPPLSFTPSFSSLFCYLARFSVHWALLSV